MTNRHLRILAFISCVAVFTASFCMNLFGIAGGVGFDGFESYSESVVIAPAGAARVGMASPNLGKWSDTDPTTFVQRAFDRFLVPSAPDAHVEAYSSQFGLQGLAVKAYSSVSPFKPDTDLVLLRGTAAVALAVVMVWIVISLSAFGRTAAVLFGACLFLSPWLTAFARNLYWVTALWFLPLAVSAHYCARVVNGRTGVVQAAVQATPWLFLAVTIKSLCGYEYLTAILLSAAIPWAMAATRLAPDTRSMAAAAAFTSTSMVAGFVAAVCIHAAHSGLDVILERAAQRTYGAGSDPIRLLDAFGVIAIYLKSPLHMAGLTAMAPMSVGGLLAAGALVWTSAGGKRRSDLDAWAVAAALGIVSSLSWHVAAQNHSTVHTHLNHVLWWLSALPFIVGLAGACIATAHMRHPAQQGRLLAAAAMAVSIVVLAGIATEDGSKAGIRKGLVLGRVGEVEMRVAPGKIFFIATCGTKATVTPILVSWSDGTSVRVVPRFPEGGVCVGEAVLPRAAGGPLSVRASDGDATKDVHLDPKALCRQPLEVLPTSIMPLGLRVNAFSAFGLVRISLLGGATLEFPSGPRKVTSVMVPADEQATYAWLTLDPPVTDVADLKGGRLPGCPG